MRDLSSERSTASSHARSAPLLSLIIPTFNVESCIGPCIDAIASQEFSDIEIIVADGASTDATRAVLEKRARDEPRLTVQWAAQRIGPGRARNAGADKATGAYLWFVDADDLVTQDSLAAISDRLAKHRPDLLLIDHEELQADSETRKVRETGAGRETRKVGQDHRLIVGSDNEPFTIAQRLPMLELGLVSWNKIIRREFFESTGAEFAAAWPHEDVQVSCELMLTAREIRILDHVCYLYRRDNPGSLTNAGKRYRHFNVFDAWRPVLKRNRDKLAAPPGGSQVTEEVYHALFHRAIWHCSTILDTPGYVARPDRRAFLDQLSGLYAEYVPDGYRPPGGFRGVKFALIAKDSYLGYATLDPLNKARVAARGLLPRR
jgi:CDP-glycerol glycerophosphotransferase